MFLPSFAGTTGCMAALCKSELKIALGEKRDEECVCVVLCLQSDFFI